MSLSNDSKLWILDFETLDKACPALDVDCLPGRVAGLSHLMPQTGILLPDRERYWPDMVTVTSSGVRGIEPGDVWVVAPGHGLFMEDAYEKRELRLFGVSCPWWESFVAKVTEEGLAPGPGWMLIEREKEKLGKFDQREPGYSAMGEVVADCTDQPTMVGQTVEFSHYVGGIPTRTFYTFKGGPESWCAVRAPIASRKWLRGLEC